MVEKSVVCNKQGGIKMKWVFCDDCEETFGEDEIKIDEYGNEICPFCGSLNLLDDDNHDL
jgi:hypothetical protein